MSRPKPPCTQPLGLTDAEVRVMDLMLATGYRKRVASALGCGLCTVNDHIKKVLAKLDVHRTDQALLIWDRVRRDAQADELRRALQRLLESDSEGQIANASDADLVEAAQDHYSDSVIRERAAAVLQARQALHKAQGTGPVVVEAVREMQGALGRH